MIRNLDVKAAKQTKKSDYTSQAPIALHLKDIPFTSAPVLQNSYTMANKYPYDSVSSLPFLRMPYLNYSSSLSLESLENLRDANELLKQEVQKLQVEVCFSYTCVVTEKIEGGREGVLILFFLKKTESSYT
jgi:hypothetical protein